MDPVQQSAMKGAADLGLGEGVESIRTATKYLIRGRLTRLQLDRIALKALANATIEEVHVDQPEVAYPLHELEYRFELKRIPIREADDEQLLHISREGVLSLSLEEMRTIQAHFRELGHEPTDLELEILAQTWSEHCVHKTLKGRVTYEGPIPAGWEAYADGEGRLVIDNLLKETIARATRELDKPWCVSVFVDNAGVIEFDEEHDVCFKVETHNHPSAIEPYGGANTGIGGVIRDPLGTGIGSRPIVNTDVFCFGPPDMAEEDVPPGALHPRRVMMGVVAGVRDYGNRMGIPTVNGAVYFDERYTGNPLVYCGNIGLMGKDSRKRRPDPGDLVVVVGGRTGRDGIHGATFSSIELTSESEEVSSGAVQIGNAITEKKVLDTLLEARERGLYTAITDCGAGGLSSAVGEMGEETGAEAEIQDVPLKYQGLSYTEIWISEAQERMVIAVPPANLDEVMGIFESEDVEATVIGRFTDDHKLTVRYGGNVVAELDMAFMHDGVPRIDETGSWQPPALPDPAPDGEALAGPEDWAAALRAILAAPNVRSKEWIVRQYRPRGAGPDGRQAAGRGGERRPGGRLRADARARLDARHRRRLRAQSAIRRHRHLSQRRQRHRRGPAQHHRRRRTHRPHGHPGQLLLGQHAPARAARHAGARGPRMLRLRRRLRRALHQRQGQPEQRVQHRRRGHRHPADSADQRAGRGRGRDEVRYDGPESAGQRRLPRRHDLPRTRRIALPRPLRPDRQHGAAGAGRDGGEDDAQPARRHHGRPGARLPRPERGRPRRGGGGDGLRRRGRPRARPLGGPLRGRRPSSASTASCCSPSRTAASS